MANVLSVMKQGLSHANSRNANTNFAHHALLHSQKINYHALCVGVAPLSKLISHVLPTKWHPPTSAWLVINSHFAPHVFNLQITKVIQFGQKKNYWEKLNIKRPTFRSHTVFLTKLNKFWMNYSSRSN